MKIPKVSVRKDSTTGSFFLEYRYCGCRRRPRVGSNREDAEELAVEYRRFFREGKDPEREIERERSQYDASAISLSEFFPVFMEHRQTKLSTKTQQLYRTCMDNIERCHQLSEVPLEQVRKSLVIDYMNQRLKQDGVKPATANREVQLLKTMLNHAVKLDIVNTSPLKGLELFREDNRRDVSNITPEQIQALLDELPYTISNVVEFAVYTGIRKENILSLSIDQVIFYDLAEGGEVRLVTKGGKAEHKPLGRQAVAVVKRSIGERTQGFVFQSPKGPRYHSIHKTFDRAARKLGVKITDGRKLQFHDLRRLCATWLLNRGRSLDEVREILGHADRRTTDRYARLRVSGDVFDVLPSVRRGYNKKPR